MLRWLRPSISTSAHLLIGSTAFLKEFEAQLLVVIFGYKDLEVKFDFKFSVATTRYKDLGFQFLVVKLYCKEFKIPLEL